MMKRKITSAGFLLLFLGFASFKNLNTNITPINIGQKMPRTFTRVREVNNQHLIIKDLYNENGLCVLFSSNTCPFVIAWENRYNKIYDACQKNKIGFIVLNSNEEKRKGNDSFFEMQKRAKDKGYKFYYAEDKSSKMADALGATLTPEVFLFDKFQVLEYKGAIDDNFKEEKLVKTTYLLNAIDHLGKNKKPVLKEIKGVGCDIKRAKE